MYSPRSFFPYVLLGVLFLQTVTVFSQDQETISDLSNKLANTSNDKEKVDLYEGLAWEYRLYDTEKTRFFAKKGLELTKTLDYPVGAANCYNRLGNSFEFEGVYDSALVAYFAALGLDSLQEDTYPKGRDYHMIAVVYQKKGDYEQAIAHELKSIDALKSPPETERKELALALVYNSLGNAYMDIGKYQLGLENFRDGLSIQEERNDFEGISKSYNEIGMAYEAIGLYKSALSYHQKSLTISRKIQFVQGMAKSLQNMGNIYFQQGQYDSALTNYQRSLDFSLSDKMATQDLIHAMGRVYEKKEDYPKALRYLQESLVIREAAGEEGKIAESYCCIAGIKIKQGKQVEGLKDYRKALSLAKKVKNPHFEAEALSGIAAVYSAQGEYEKAFSSYQLSMNIRDSLNKAKQQTTDIDKILAERRLDEEIQGKDIELLEKDIDLKTAKKEKKLILQYSFIAGFFLLLMVLFTSLLSHRHKQLATIAEQQVKLGRNEIDDLIKTQELKLMTAMLEGQDEERNRLSADLHDRLGGILALVRLHFNSVEESIHQLAAQNQEQYALATDLLAKASDTVREISHDIGDSLLMKLGLIPAIEDLANTIETSKKLSMSLIHQGIVERLPSKIEKNLFKVIQELLSNILKHAEAQNVTLNLFLKDEHLSVTVEDDGKGFDTKAAKIKDGIGMLNIKARVKELNGTLEIDSQISHGTTVTMEIPCPSITS